jgi:hypothetical protein
MPWLVVAYGILVIPVSVASIALIILQPVAVGAWCSWCLGIALIMLVMIILTAPELAAVTQLLFQTKREGKPFWKVFWNGVSARESAAKKNQGRKIKQQAWGITLPWTLLASFVFGIWLMISPALLNSHNVVAISNYIGGPLVSTFSIIALAEAFRSIRLINILLGAGLILAPWLAPSLDAYSVSNNVVVGLLIIALALPKGKIHERYGSWEKMII